MNKPMMVLLGLCTSAVWSQDLKPHFEAGTAFVWGQATELVLRDGTYHNPLSRLTWDIPPSSAVYMNLDWPWTAYTSTRLSLQGSWPWMSGSTVNEDWDTGPPDNIKHSKSVSEARLITRYTASAEQTLAFSGFRILGGVLYRQTSWEAWNGTYDYKYDGGSENTGTFSGLIQEYRQLWVIPYAGVTAAWRAGDWDLVPLIRLSPVTWCMDIDNHMLAVKRITFEDYFIQGFYTLVSVEAAQTAQNTVWGLRASWELTYGAVGDTVQTEPGVNFDSSTTYSNAAGAWFQEFSLAIFVRN